MDEIAGDAAVWMFQIYSSSLTRHEMTRSVRKGR